MSPNIPGTIGDLCPVARPEAVGKARQDPREIESAIVAFGREPGGGLIVMPDSFNIVHRNQIMALAAQHRLPIISPYRFMTQEED